MGNCFHSNSISHKNEIRAERREKKEGVKLKTRSSTSIE